MKLQLDTTNKTIKIEEMVSLGEFYDMLNKLLPEEEWKEYSLQVINTIKGFNEPTTIPWTPMPTNPFDPSFPIPPNPNPSVPWMVYDDGVNTGTLGDYTINQGVFNINMTNAEAVN